MNADAHSASVIEIEHNAYRVPGTVLLTMNRPDAFNALSEALLDELQSALTEIARSDARVVVIAGGGRAFCAGHDLKEMRAAPSLAYYQQLFARCTKLMMTIQRLPQPVIARVQGIATAAGCQLVAMCDLAVAADTARFATSGIHYGLFCSTPMVPLARAVGPKPALEMLLTGKPISARRALELGLVNRVVPPDQLDAAVGEFADAIVASS